jgi:hypothetical protein
MNGRVIRGYDNITSYYNIILLSPALCVFAGIGRPCQVVSGASRSTKISNRHITPIDGRARGGTLSITRYGNSPGTGANGTLLHQTAVGPPLAERPQYP